MIRFTDDSLVIELHTTSPLETLSGLQQALTDCIAFRDTDQRGDRADMMLWHVANLLEASQFNVDQMMTLERCLSKMPATDRKQFAA